MPAGWYTVRHLNSARGVALGERVHLGGLRIRRRKVAHRTGSCEPEGDAVDSEGDNKWKKPSEYINGKIMTKPGRARHIHRVTMPSWKHQFKEFFDTQ